MKRILAILVCIFAFLPGVVFAAYQNPTIETSTRQRDGSYLIVFKFTGNAGEPDVFKPYTVNKGTTAQAVRNWVDDSINELDAFNTAGKLASLQPGQTVPRLARTAPAAPSPKQVWQEKFFRYMQYKNADIAAMASALAALKADLEATYQAGFND